VNDVIVLYFNKILHELLLFEVM